MFKVIKGSRIELDAADCDWLNDNAYHSIEINRAGSAISIHFDGNVILSANDSSLGAGKVGVGSYNDSAVPSNPPSAQSTPRMTITTNH